MQQKEIGLTARPRICCAMQWMQCWAVNTEELKQLEEAAKRTQAELDAMIATLDENAREHKAFMNAMAKLRKSA
jgi:hypothetical protein